MYELEFTEDALDDIEYLEKTDPAAYRKLEFLLLELSENPRYGTGQVELLKYGLRGYYSRRITRKHRLVYRIDNDVLLVIVVSARGHYSDK